MALAMVACSLVGEREREKALDNITFVALVAFRSSCSSVTLFTLWPLSPSISVPKVRGSAYWLHCMSPVLLRDDRNY